MSQRLAYFAYYSNDATGITWMACRMSLSVPCLMHTLSLSTIPESETAAVWLTLLQELWWFHVELWTELDRA